ncbi:hypothetical protein [Umezawaea tangerina]|uniref:Uncharacterized protein n=1 Tax=Umezawaea tangerina TaxID=84725 RepID=A0A2T0SPK2_9PSEU|nr:hypothetical protein [Umezawaea tangerina]PRY35326.1 hypothetical protein CLV43_114244 [Umezawaea tangerina]
MTVILRTLNGVPVTITHDEPEAWALAVSEFHYSTPDVGGVHCFSHGGKYDATNRRGLKQVDVVREFAIDCLDADRDRLMAAWAAGCNRG